MHPAPHFRQFDQHSPDALLGLHGPLVSDVYLMWLYMFPKFVPKLVLGSSSASKYTHDTNMALSSVHISPLWVVVLAVGLFISHLVYTSKKAKLDHIPGPWLAK